jgi:cell division transport system ATP-binding protein
VIRLYKARKEFAGGRVALRDVSFDVAAGEMVLVTGPSGSGKSVLVRILFGAESLTDGQGIVGGRNLARLDGPTLAALRRNLGVVSQGSPLIDRLCVLDNIALAAEVAGESRAAARARGADALDMVGLSELADAPAHVLSAGERQRVGLARALVNRPSLLLADEPTSSLDPDSAEQIIALLKEVHRDGTTVLVATHDEDARASFDCRTLMMYHGRVFEEDDGRVASSL